MTNDNKIAIEILNQGGIVIFPTDTAFGIGCRIDRETAIKKLFTIRKRPASQAVPVLVNSLSMAQKYWSSPLPDIVRRLTNKYWPGGLTIVYYAQIDKTPLLVRGGSDTLGLRMPDHEITLELIRGVGVPLLGPSANFHGGPTPFKHEGLDSALLKKVDYVLTGDCKTKISSTVVDCTTDTYKIIRQGAVKIKK